MAVGVEPGSALLDVEGGWTTLAANALDADGEPDAGEVTWHSTHPEIVMPDASGLVASQGAVGSTQVWAEVGGVLSDPVLVLVARFREGSVPLTDDQVAGEPVARDDGGVDVSLLHGLPGVAPGALLVSTQTAPVSGRVVTVTPAGATDTVTLEIVPVAELFDEFQIEEVFDLPDEELTFVSETSGLRAAPGEEDDCDGFSFLGFCCEHEVSPSFGIERAFDFGVTPTLSVSFVLETRWLSVVRHSLTVTGGATLRASGSLEVSAAIEAELDCSKDLKTIPIPVGGALSAFLSPMLVIGAGVELGVEVDVQILEVGAAATLGATVTAGYSWTPATGLTTTHEFTGTSSFEPTFEMPDTFADALTVEGSLKPYLSLSPGLKALPWLPADETELGLLNVPIGPRFSVRGATPATAAADDEFESGYSLGVHGEVKVAEDVSTLLEKLGVTSGDLPALFEHEIPVSHTPKGTLNGPATARPTEVQTLRVLLDPSTQTFLGVHNLDSVELYRSVDGGDLESFATLVSAGAGETELALEWAPTEEEAGLNTFVLFAHPVLLSSLPPAEMWNGHAWEVRVEDLDLDGHTVEAGDCDDHDPEAYPGAAEACDEKDNDCDGAVDEPGPDGLPDCDGTGDDDTVSDDDATADDDATPPVDTDGDGFLAPQDCREGDASFHPGAPELCDGLDHDCDHSSWCGLFVSDADHDGYYVTGSGFFATDGVVPWLIPGVIEVVETVDPGYPLTDEELLDIALANYLTGDGDCDDLDPTIHPGACELCDGRDSDCDPDGVDCTPRSSAVPGGDLAGEFELEWNAEDSPWQYGWYPDGSRVTFARFADRLEWGPGVEAWWDAGTPARLSRVSSATDVPAYYVVGGDCVTLWLGSTPYVDGSGVEVHQYDLAYPGGGSVVLDPGCVHVEGGSYEYGHSVARWTPLESAWYRVDVSFSPIGGGRGHATVRRDFGGGFVFYADIEAGTAEGSTVERCVRAGERFDVMVQSRDGPSNYHTVVEATFTDATDQDLDGLLDWEDSMPTVSAVPWDDADADGIPDDTDPCPLGGVSADLDNDWTIDCEDDCTAIDLDRDWYQTCSGDCDDLDPAVNPFAPEILGDGLDQDCDGVAE